MEQLSFSIYDKIPQLIHDWQELVVIAGTLIKQVSTRHSVNQASFLHLPATGILFDGSFTKEKMYYTSD